MEKGPVAQSVASSVHFKPEMHKCWSWLTSTRPALPNWSRHISNSNSNIVIVIVIVIAIETDGLAALKLWAP